MLALGSALQLSSHSFNQTLKNGNQRSVCETWSLELNSDRWLGVPPEVFVFNKCTVIMKLCDRRSSADTPFL